MSVNANAITHFITSQFQRDWKLPGSIMSIMLVTAIADAAIQYFADRNITNFQYYTAERNIKFLPTFNASSIATWIRLGTLACSFDSLCDVIVTPKTRINRILTLSGKCLAIVAFLSLFMSMLDKLEGFRLWVKRMSQLEDINEGDPDDPIHQVALRNVNVSWHKPEYEVNAQRVAFVQAITNIVLAVFSDSKLFFAALASLNLYTLAQITKRDWLQSVCRIENIYYVYSTIFLIDANPKDNTCVVCQDIPSRKYYFCPNHSNDLPCLIKALISATGHFKIEGQPIRNEILKNNRIERVVYTVNAKESMKPRCPSCRAVPSYSSLSMFADDDKTSQCCDVTINWI